MSYVLAFAFGYLLGSIPFGLLLTRAAGAPDIRTIGSGNIGATNVLRTGRKWLAAVTLFCDMFKGTVAVLVAKHFGIDAALAAGLGAFVGHLFPVWLEVQRRQRRRDLHRCAHRSLLAGGIGILRDLAFDCRSIPIFITCRIDSERPHAPWPLGFWSARMPRRSFFF